MKINATLAGAILRAFESSAGKFGRTISANADGITISGTNATLRVAIPSATLAPVTYARDIARDMITGATVTPTDTGATVTNGKGLSFTIPNAPDAPPALAPVPNGVPVNPADVAWVASASATDYGMPILCAVRFDGDKVAATDRFRLHVADLPMPCAGTVPAASVAWLARVPAATVAIDTDLGVATIASGSISLTVRTVLGDFPNFGNIIPETTHPVMPAENVAIVKPYLADKAVCAVKVSATGADVFGFRPKSKTPGDVLATVNATSAGQTFTVNAAYLGAALAGCQGAIESADTAEMITRPLVIRDGSRMALLMPIRN